MPRYLIDLSLIFLFEQEVRNTNIRDRASAHGGVGRWIDPSWWTH